MPAFIQLKSIGKTNAAERTISITCGGKGVFRVDCGNVVGKQDNFIGVQFVQKFSRQIFGVDKVAFNEPRDKSSCACERVEYVNIFIGEPALEIFFKYGVDRAQNKIDDFDGRINNAEAVSGLF